MNFLFLIMSPFFFFFGLIFLMGSFIFSSMNFSLMVYWNFYSSTVYICFPLYFDYISCLFMAMVLFISGSIIFYSEYYMGSEFYKGRFFFLMFFFVLSMIFLILCPNFFCMLLGWDGLGLISYGLVIYYQNYKSYASGMITALTNRVGDVFILSSIALFFCMGNFNYMDFLSSKNLFWLSLFFVIASMTKSAQIPFSAWLPAAMAAPTPVSSLVHSSTLVTAGIYIMIRFSYFLTDKMKFFLMVISLLTMIMSGFSGMMEFDLKKIIALSTLSQLGFMMSTISLGFSELAFFHLVTHAGFKALLFMCAGLFIHSFFDVQDIRGYGMMSKNFSLVLCMFNVANLSLSGFPFLSGFFSKDLILELVLMGNMNFLVFFLFMLGTFLTFFYSFRLFIFLTLKNYFYFSSVENNMKVLGVQYSMFLLFFFSICLGFFASNLFFLPYNYIVLPFGLKMIISLICLVSFFISLNFSSFYKMKKNLSIMFFSQMWFLGFLKTDFLKKMFFISSYKISKSMVGFVELNLGMQSLHYIDFVSFYLNFVMKKFFSFFFLMFLIFSFFFFTFFA
uniref:NADH dehydrogenase subunit 5 n=1 Tax=Mycterothrips gongshanensis TaxID=2792509 RepID=UPI00220C0C85|nr:NADH dehydrogenase subunit 5 [Mycterothrips gongshanensis]UXW64211.1 NADH dehydrogenase subunit 5 [Mycterothrips gongshanensis]